MERIIEPNESFPFHQLTLTSPTMIPGGNYFIKYLLNKEPLYIQLPKCKTKQGITKAGKKFYCDLLFTNENEEFIRWVEELESASQKIIFENRSKWFENELEMHDIEASFSPSLKLFKSGKYYLLRQVSLPTRLGKCTLKIFDENETEVDMTAINDQTNLLTILEVQGIRCSVKSFQIDFEIKQMMIIKPELLFEKCMIARREPAATEPRQNTQSLGNTSIPTNDEPDEMQNDLESKSPPTEEALEPQDAPDPTQEPLQSEEETTKEDTANDSLASSPMEEIVEVDFPIESIDPNNTVEIKARNDVYYQIYQDARQKAKEAKRMALIAHLEAKKIKELYNLEDLDDSDTEDNDGQF
jgi:hypothetical protein